MNIQIQMIVLWTLLIFNQSHWYCYVLAGIGLFLALDDLINN